MRADRLKRVSNVSKQEMKTQKELNALVFHDDLKVLLESILEPVG